MEDRRQARSQKTAVSTSSLPIVKKKRHGVSLSRHSKGISYRCLKITAFRPLPYALAAGSCHCSIMHNSFTKKMVVHSTLPVGLQLPFSCTCEHKLSCVPNRTHSNTTSAMNGEYIRAAHTAGQANQKCLSAWPITLRPANNDVHLTRQAMRKNSNSENVFFNKSSFR